MPFVCTFKLSILAVRWDTGLMWCLALQCILFGSSKLPILAKVKAQCSFIQCIFVVLFSLHISVWSVFRGSIYWAWILAQWTEMFLVWSASSVQSSTYECLTRSCRRKYSHKCLRNNFQASERSNDHLESLVHSMYYIQQKVYWCGNCNVFLQCIQMYYNYISP